MPTNFYYVYALKDPRTSPARPFYIGKGTGSRAYDYLVKPDATRKYARIKTIIESREKTTRRYPRRRPDGSAGAKTRS